MLVGVENRATHQNDSFQLGGDPRVLEHGQSDVGEGASGHENQRCTGFHDGLDEEIHSVPFQSFKSGLGKIGSV